MENIFFSIVFAWARTHAMQAGINAATAPSTAASGVLTNCATETSSKKVIQIALIKATDAAVHLIYRSLVFLRICFALYGLFFTLSNYCSDSRLFSFHNEEIIPRAISKSLRKHAYSNILSILTTKK